MSDIYDGEIWKTFPSSLNTLNVARFFEPETADRHLGIMINLDWFQPFKSVVYSCRAIYGVICNLPRTSRNNPIRPIFKLPKVDRKLVKCLPIISKKIGK